MEKRLNLALQGGGAHGAFTWGVLDRLLDEKDIEIAAISGTSAGALNAAALKAGLLRDGRAGAKENLAWLWEQVGAITDERLQGWLAPFAVATPAVARALEYSPLFAALTFAENVLTPYGMGPLTRNPLERIVEQFHFEDICAAHGPALHICATNVRTGKIRVFAGPEIGTQAILASACLPTMFEAVEIEDPATGRAEPYWDGGYAGNPALWPLFVPELPDDILIVNINPLNREDVPTTPQQIQNRINEISFNASLLRELRAISFVKRLIDAGKVEPGQMKDVKVHMVADDVLMNELSVATKMIPVASVLYRLREAGHAAMDAFLTTHRADIGARSTVDLEQMFG